MKTDVPLQLRYGGLVLLILGPIMILLGGGSFLAARNAQSWPTVAAHVTRSEVEVSKKVSGFRRSYTTSSDYYTAAVEYEFVVEGKPYTADHIRRTSNPSGFDRSEIVQWTRKYPRGAEITVHYCPGKPSLAVIDPTPDVLGFSLILGGGLIMIPVGLVLRRVARHLQPEAPRPAAVSRPAAVKPAAVTKSATVPSQPAAIRPPAVEQPAVTTVSQSARTANISQPVRKPLHYSLRTIAVVLGLFFFFLGAVVFPTSVEHCWQAVRVPGPDAADTVARFITMAIVGSMAILGAFLICKGAKSTRQAVPH